MRECGAKHASCFSPLKIPLWINNSRILLKQWTTCGHGLKPVENIYFAHRRSITCPDPSWPLSSLLTPRVTQTGASSHPWYTNCFSFNNAPLSPITTDAPYWPIWDYVVIELTNPQHNTALAILRYSLLYSTLTIYQWLHPWQRPRDATNWMPCIPKWVRHVVFPPFSCSAQHFLLCHPTPPAGKENIHVRTCNAITGTCPYGSTPVMGSIHPRF